MPVLTESTWNAMGEIERKLLVGEVIGPIEAEYRVLPTSQDVQPLDVKPRGRQVASESAAGKTEKIGLTRAPDN